MVDRYMAWFMISRQNKWGNQKTIFCFPGYCYPEDKNIFMNISAKTKIFFKNILGYCSRAQVLSIHAKKQSSKISCYSPFNSVLSRFCLPPCMYCTLSSHCVSSYVLT